jgi:pyruvate/2-oxoglutarate/acetoin dehydrogenase E1 component
MSNYIAALNDLIVAATAKLPNAVLYGENIDTGSRISGLTRNLKVPLGGRIINVGDCEATHCGVGFGMALDGGTAVLFAKQLDFMLLGIDHFVSTYNFIRCRPRPELGSFTIIAIVCDQGLQGPQSSFNALGDICSLARVDGYTLTNNQEALHVLNSQLGKPGFRFIALSQRMFGTECLDLKLVHASPDSSLFQYSDGDDVTIVCFNFSLPHGLALQQQLARVGLAASLFSANYVAQPDWTRIAERLARSRKLVVLDDSKSLHSRATALVCDLLTRVCPFAHVVVSRGDAVEFGVSSEEFTVDGEAIVAQLTRQAAYADR